MTGTAGTKDTPPLRRASYVLHLVSQNQLDRQHGVSFDFGQIRLARILDSVLDTFDREPRFHHFMLDGQAILIEDYLAIRPEHFERVERVARDGRLLLGPWYIQPEPVLVSGESLIRNLMIGLRTARVFGRPLNVAYMPVAAWLPGQMPQILRGFLIDTAILAGRDEEPASELRWSGTDGTQIVVGQLWDAQPNYGLGLKKRRDAIAPYSQSGHLLLVNIWRRPYKPDQIEALVNALTAAHSEFHDDVFHSSLAAYAGAIEKALRDQSVLVPEVRGELPLTRSRQGILSARLWIKRRNTEVERLLTRWIEPFSAWAETLSPASVDLHLRHPQTVIQKAWRSLLENQNPSLLRGSAVDDAYSDVAGRYAQIERAKTYLLGPMLGDIAARVDTRKLPVRGDQSVLVFNPSAHVRTDLASAEVLASEGLVPVIYDANGNRIPASVRQIGEDEDGILDRVQFIAKDVPALGYTSYAARLEAPIPVEESVDTQDFIVENTRIQVALDVQHMTLTLRDKFNGISYEGLLDLRAEAVAGSALQYESVVRFVQTDRRMFPREVTRIEAPFGSTMTFPITLTLELLDPSGAIHTSKAGKTELTTYVTLSLLNDLPRLDLSLRVDNNLSSYRLLANFPIPFRAESAYYDSHFEIVRRPIDAGIVPQGSFVGVFEPVSSDELSGEDDVPVKLPGLLIANRGLPEAELTSGDDGSVVILTLLRSVHAPDAPDAALLGPQIAELSLIPVGQIDFREAWSFADGPFETIAVSDQMDPEVAGTLPQSASLIAVSSPDFRISAVKPPEEGSGLIVRGYNITGTSIWVTLTPWRRFAQAEVVTLDEAVTGGKLAVEPDGAIRFRVDPHRILTFWFHD